LFLLKEQRSNEMSVLYQEDEQCRHRFIQRDQGKPDEREQQATSRSQKQIVPVERKDKKKSSKVNKRNVLK
jgi:hypothetical protein